MRAPLLIKENVDALLKERGMTRKDLAQWCRHSESWISKIFTSSTKTFPVKYLDRIADFFGLVPYQLYQPGIAKSTERRVLDRRRRADRRISHAQRASSTRETADVQRDTLPPATLDAFVRQLQDLQATLAILATSDAGDDRSTASHRARKPKARKVAN